MNLFLRSTLALGLVALFGTVAVAQEAVIRKNISERMPDFPKIDEVTKTTIPGLCALVPTFSTPTNTVTT